MNKKNCFSIEEHHQIADDFALIEFLVKKIDRKCVENFNKTSNLCKSIRKFTSNSGYLSQLKNHLDNEFHKVIDDDTWGKLLAEGHGHIYYKSYKRFDPKLYMH